MVSSKTDLSAFKARLTREREELQQLMETSGEARRPVDLDQSRIGRLSRMDALQGQAMAIETERRRKLELRRIEAALERIEKGEFGYCVRCGEEIAAKRLEFEPTAPVCISCAGGGR